MELRHCFARLQHIVDQSSQVILVDDYPLLSHAVFEALAARSCSSTINFSGSMKQDECAFHISLTARKLRLIA
jgi:hypothetical protein